MRKLRIITTIIAIMFTSIITMAQTTVQDTVCVGAVDVDYYVTNTAGSTYDWTLTGGGTITTGATTNAIKITWAAGTGTDTLKVTETNSNSCQGDPVVLAITRVALPVANAGTDATIGNCAAQSTTLDASGSTGSGTLTYSWSPTTGLSASDIVNPVASPNTTTTYTVTVSSSVGCSATDNVKVTVDAAPVAITAADVSIGNCGGQSTDIDGSSSTGTGITYSWTSSPAGFTSTNATVSVSPAATTTYTLEVSDSHGCTDSETQTVTVDAAPLATITATNDTIGSCVGQSTTIDASTSTGNGITYSWTSNPAGFTSTLASPAAISPAATTTYTVVITDTYGCTSTDNQLITVEAAPVADAGTPATICSGNATTLDATASTGSSITYAWTSSPAGFNSTVASPSVSPGVNTTYTVEITDKNGCTSTDNVLITVNSGPTVTVAVGATFCEGEVVSLSATAANYTSLLWSTTGDGTFDNTAILAPDYTPGTTDNTNGTATLTLTASGNAPCTSANDPKTITINPKPNTSGIFHY